MIYVSSVIPDKKINYLQYDDLKGLNVEDLATVRREALDILSKLENRISTAFEWDDISPLTAVKVHLKRVIGCINGISKSKNRARNSGSEVNKKKLKAANIEIVSLKKQLKLLRAENSKLRKATLSI